MNDDLNEKLSAFIDNDLHDDALIDELSNNPQARATMVRYRLIADVLNNHYIPSGVDVSSRVHAALDQEATIISPKRWFTKSNVLKQMSGLAVAATVAAVAILVVGDFSPENAESTNVAVGPITYQPIQMTSAMQRKLNGYLVSHNEFSASNRMRGVLSYSRIASSTRGERIVVKAGATLEK